VAVPDAAAVVRTPELCPCTQLWASVTVGLVLRGEFQPALQTKDLIFPLEK